MSPYVNARWAKVQRKYPPVETLRRALAHCTLTFILLSKFYAIGSQARITPGRRPA